MSILLKGGTVVSAYNRRQLDIRIDGEQIVEMGANLPVENSQIEDVTGCYVLPGFIDAHTHLELNNGKGSLSTADNFTTGAKRRWPKVRLRLLIWLHLIKAAH